MSGLQTWTWDEICDLWEDLEEEGRVPGPLAQPHAVYRLYGPHDLILYIGCTRDPRNRLATHKSLHKDTWWPYVQRHELSWFPSRAPAQEVETAELRRHRPLCNPVIPEANGKHITTTADRKPVRSLWAQVDEIARAHDVMVMDIIEQGLESYVRRHRKEQPS